MINGTNSNLEIYKSIEDVFPFLNKRRQSRERTT